MAIRTEIFINKQKLDLTQDIPFVLNYQISDIRNPETRKTDTSYTVQVTGTKNNNKIFSHIYNIAKEILSSDLSVNYTPDYNPNLKTDAVIYVDGLPIFNGYCKLEEVVNVKGSITYNLSFKGQLGSIFNTIKNLKLTDLDLAKDLMVFQDVPPELEMWTYQTNSAVTTSTFDTINIIASNAANYQIRAYNNTGTYYTLPLIDKGNQVESEFELNTVYPAWSLSSYIYAIFKNAGYSYKSNFFKSEFFNNIYVPYLDTYNLPVSEITNRTSYIAVNTYTASTLYSTYNQVTAPQFREGTKIEDYGQLYFNDFNLPYSLGNNTIDSNGIITITKQGYYSFNANLSLTIPSIFKVDGVDCYWSIDQNKSGGYVSIRELRGYRDINGVQTSYGTTLANVGANFRLSNTLTINAEVTNYRVEAGKQYFVQYSVQVWGDVKRVSDNATVIGNTNKIYNYVINGNGTNFKITPVSNLLFSGDTYVLNSFIPKDVSCTDLLLSTFKLFNLQVDVDKEDKTGKTLIIEPFQDFYNKNTILDWNNKLDTSKPISFKPISEIDAKTYTFTYTPDDDYYNQAYTRIYGDEIYGQKQVEVQNDFVTQNKKVEVIFSPLLPVKFATTNLIAPRCYDADENGNITQRDKNNIRLFYKGETRAVDYTLIQRSQSGVISKDKRKNYFTNFFGHTDQPFRPNLDIMFNAPRQVFWNGVQAYTNYNLYNRFYKSYIDNITSKDSKLLKCYIYLTPLDIYNFSFRNYVQVMGQNFRVNRISNYNPLSNSSTEVELFKLTNETGFEASEIQLENESVNPSDVYYIIDAGVDTVRSPLATSPYNLINAGLDEVRGFGSMSSINLINGGEDTI